MADLFDVLIVGGGPGGLTAGLYCARARLRTLLVDKGPLGGQIIASNQVEDYPGFELITGAELIERMEQQARKAGLEIQYRTVTSIRSEGPAHAAETGEGPLKARTVILAAGGSARRLGVPGEQELSGKGVTYCAICDAPLFRGKTVCVVGGGDSAAEEATMVSKYAAKVYLIHRRDRLRAQKILQERLVADPKIEIRWDTVIERIEGADAVSRVILRHVKTQQSLTLDVEGVFVAIGFEPNAKLFGAGPAVQTDARGYVLTDSVMQTSRPGVFAIGDVRSQLCKQVTNACGDGTTAAIAAQKYLEGALSQVAHGSLGLFIDHHKGATHVQTTDHA